MHNLPKQLPKEAQEQFQPTSGQSYAISLQGPQQFLFCSDFVSLQTHGNNHQSSFFEKTLAPQEDEYPPVSDGSNTCWLPWIFEILSDRHRQTFSVGRTIKSGYLRSTA